MQLIQRAKNFAVRKATELKAHGEEIAADEKAETILKVISGLAIGISITVLILANIFSATDTAITELNDTDATSGYESVKSYTWVGLPLLGVLIIVIVGRQLIDNT